MRLKTAIIVTSFLLVSALEAFSRFPDWTVNSAHFFIHQLYFLVIIAAAIWFDFRGAIITAVLAVGTCSIFALMVWPLPQAEYGNLAGQILGILIVAGVSGLLVKLEHRSATTATRKHRENESANVTKVVMALGEALSARDADTQEHCRRVAQLARNFARFLGLAPHDIDDIYLAGILHDAGRIRGRDAILISAEGLSTTECRIATEHSRIAEKMLAPIGFSTVSRYVAVHHENWDGSGYPEGIAGDAIPLPARILAIADTYDALWSDQPYYNRRIRNDRLQRIMSSMSGNKLDESLLQKFWDFQEQVTSIAHC